MKKKILQKNNKPEQKAKFELSAGGIVYNSKLKKILIIEYHDGRFAFPKGHNEKGESMIETAKREIAEETDVKNLKFLAKLGEVKFFYKLKNNFIFKKIIYFLFETKETKTKPQTIEIKDSVWVKTSQVKKLIPFKNLLPIWEKAYKLIQKNERKITTILKRIKH